MADEEGLCPTCRCELARHCFNEWCHWKFCPDCHAWGIPDKDHWRESMWGKADDDRR